MGMFDKVRANAEANLAKNDAGKEALNRQIEATADVAQADGVADGQMTNPVDDTVVNDVINGKYGTGEARKSALLEAGYDPTEVQSKVNAVLAESKAKKQAPQETATQEIVEQQQPEENFQISKDMSNDLPENVMNDLMSSDEGQAAQQAVEANDPTALQNIVSPEGQPVMAGSYDSEGRYIPHTYSRLEGSKLQNKGWAGVATIISIALSGLAGLAGIPLAPVNFYKLLGTDEFVDELNENEKNYAKLVNAGTEEKQTIEKSRTATREQNVSDIDTYKDIQDEDVQKTAQVNAATGGQNTTLDVQREQQEWNARQKELDREFEKEMANITADNQIAILKQQQLGQQELTKLMNDLEVQKTFKKIEMGKQKGMTPDEVARWIRADAGTTALAAALGYGKDIANIVGTFMPGESDKDVKKYISRNNDFLKSAWNRRK